MLRKRVIPCLLLQNGRLVKTHKFSRPQYVGDPINAIRIFNDKEVDELLVIDIEASKTNAGPNFDLIEQFASECFMPLAYGGGVETVEQAQKLFSMGVEKVCLQSAVMKDPLIISRLAEKFGTQSVVVSVDVKRDWRNQIVLYESRTRKSRSTNWLDHIRKCVELGAGEVLLNSVHRDGTLAGMDYEVIKAGAVASTAPTIAVGGARSLRDFELAFDAGASAVSAGAFFVFHGPHRAVLITYPTPRELDAVFTKARNG